jgi:hypothetical protein
MCHNRSSTEGVQRAQDSRQRGESREAHGDGARQRVAKQL